MGRRCKAMMMATTNAMQAQYDSSGDGGVGGASMVRMQMTMGDDGKRAGGAAMLLRCDKAKARQAKQ